MLLLLVSLPRRTLIAKVLGLKFFVNASKQGMDLQLKSFLLKDDFHRPSHQCLPTSRFSLFIEL